MNLDLLKKLMNIRVLSGIFILEFCLFYGIFFCFQVFRLGFGCGGFFGIYNLFFVYEEGILVIKEVFGNGIIFFDILDLCGDKYDNEIMVGIYLFYYKF